jgi:hypothetical protein
MSNTRFLDNVWLDTCYALRAARKNPAFAATAVFVLALGIGGNAAMFSVIRAVLLSPLPYQDADRLVQLSVENPTRPAPGGAFTVLRYTEMRKTARSFAGVGAYSLGQGLILALSGSALGIGGALLLTRVMHGLLFHISPADPATYISMALLWIVVALTASYIPARRAARVDPAHALRVG